MTLDIVRRARAWASVWVTDLHAALVNSVFAWGSCQLTRRAAADRCDQRAEVYDIRSSLGWGTQQKSFSRALTKWRNNSADGLPHMFGSGHR